MTKTQFSGKPTLFSPKRMLGALVAVGVAFLLLMSVIKVTQKYVAARRRIKDLTIQAQDLQQKQTTLTQANAYLATPEGTEQALREKYNVVKPGEGIIIISDTSPAPSPPQSKVSRWWNAILQGLGIRKN
ncbi:MAG TPA: hypothetical protein VG621_03055 [Candidatus Paceibacterota bacterium]|nr:hypothetical protein [Candidatus Paceibacterota bacterium]